LAVFPNLTGLGRREPPLFFSAFNYRWDNLWINAQELKIGDKLLGKNGEIKVVESIEEISVGVRSYNIQVGNDHTFFADGVLVHNKEPDPQG
jgi:intein/homing endonuclease